MSIDQFLSVVRLGYRRGDSKWAPSVINEPWIDCEPVLDGLVLNDDLEF